MRFSAVLWCLVPVCNINPSFSIDTGVRGETQPLACRRAGTGSYYLASSVHVTPELYSIDLLALVLVYNTGGAATHTSESALRSPTCTSFDALRRDIDSTLGFRCVLCTCSQALDSDMSVYVPVMSLQYLTIRHGRKDTIHYYHTHWWRTRYRFVYAGSGMIVTRRAVLRVPVTDPPWLVGTPQNPALVSASCVPSWRLHCDVRHRDSDPPSSHPSARDPTAPDSPTKATSLR